MDSTQGAPNSNEMPDHSLLESPESSQSEQMSISEADQSIDVTTEATKLSVLDEKTTPPKTRRIHPRCVQIGAFYHAKTCDVNFIFDVEGNEEVVPAHKSMLAFHSPVFRQMFNGELKEKGDIHIKDTTADAFIDFLKCIYNELTVRGSSEAKMSALLHLAHKYDVNWLEQECKVILTKSIKDNIMTILWVLPLATLYSYDELRQKCIEMIHMNGRSLIESDEFVECEKEVMKEILGIDFQHRNEVSIFETCIKWAKKACEDAVCGSETVMNIREQLGDCFNLIHFGSMTTVEFMQCLSINPGVFTLDEIQQYAKKTSGTKPQQELRKNEGVVKSKGFEIRSPFRKTACPAFQLFFEDKSTADITFALENNKNDEIDRVSAHKFILALYSKVFERQFQHAFNPSAEINISGISTDAFKDFLRLIYIFFERQFFSIVQNIAEQHIDPILSFAGTYKVRHIIKWYKLHLSRTINEQNVIGRFELSRKHSLDELETKCVDFMKENGEKIIASGAFISCSQESLKAILELRIWDEEKSLAGACVEWAKNYCKENQLDAAISYDLRSALGDAFELIPFSAMDLVEFVDFQCDYGDLFTGDEIKKVAKQVAERNKVKQTSNFCLMNCN